MVGEHALLRRVSQRPGDTLDGRTKSLTDEAGSQFYVHTTCLLTLQCIYVYRYSRTGPAYPGLGGVRRGQVSRHA